MADPSRFTPEPVFPNAGGATTGEVGGARHYDGPGLGEVGAWKCPACAAENTGPIDAGCVSCGSGSARARHVGQPPPAAQVSKSPAFQAVKADMDRAADLYQAALAWSGAHQQASLADAFVAGWQLAQAQFAAHAIAAPPVTADVATLAPEGKARRTIIAALEVFKDQILSGRPEEVASGEWCSAEEVDELIARMRAEGD